MFRIGNWIGIVALLALFLAACNNNTASDAHSAVSEAAPQAVEAVMQEEPLSQEDASTSPEDTMSAAASEAPAMSDADGLARTFQIVPEASQASYAVEEEFFNRAVRFVTAMGRTSAIEGELNVVIQDNQIQLGENHFVVDLRTLTSDSSQRDRRIRSEWLASNTYPWAEFQATTVQSFPAGAAEGQDLQFALAGDMTIREVTQPLVFDTIARLDGDTLTAEAVTYLYMRDFGFEPPSILGMLSVTDGVTVTVQLTAQAVE